MTAIPREIVTFNDPAKEINRLRRLADDLEGIVAGTAPSTADLAHAPVLDRYRITVRQDPCLAGIGGGHPTLASGPIVTSALYAISLRRSWVRTYSRFYRLGEPDTGWPQTD